MGNNLIVSPSDFADNEFWFYEGDGQSYHFLFVDDGAAYRVGDVADLIPQHLRGAMDQDTGRGGAKADVVLEVLRAVYRLLTWRDDMPAPVKAACFDTLQAETPASTR